MRNFVFRWFLGRFWGDIINSPYVIATISERTVVRVLMDKGSNFESVDSILSTAVIPDTGRHADERWQSVNLPQLTVVVKDRDGWYPETVPDDTFNGVDGYWRDAGRRIEPVPEFPAHLLPKTGGDNGNGNR